MEANIMAKKKKNQHIMYHRNWHPSSYSAQARYGVSIRLLGWKTHRYDFYDDDFSKVIAFTCNSYRCDMVKHRMIKGLRRYGKRKGLI